MDFCSSSRELNVVIDNGTFWTLSVRFCAVTVTSSSVSEGVAAGLAASAVTLQPIDAKVYTMLREARAAFEKVNSKGSMMCQYPRDQ